MDKLSLEHEVGAWDSVLLDPLTEETLLANLHQRFKRDHIYTYIGNVLVSINPFKKMGIYSSDLMTAYRFRGPYQLPPHIYAVAGSAYRFLRDRNEDQVVVVTGESGSGKTEAARAVLHFIVHQQSKGNSCCLSSCTSALPNSLQQSFPKPGAGDHCSSCIIRRHLCFADIVFEAFGHAKTCCNDNASRFGKYIDVEFDCKGDPLGGVFYNYLLDKTRITSKSANERNYHIFYQLLSGADIQLLKILKLHRNIEKYSILVGSSRSGFRDDKRDFLDTRNAMESLGFAQDDIVSILKIISAVLKLGNIVFLPVNNIDGTEGCSISNEYEVAEVHELLGCEESSPLETLLLRRSVLFRRVTLPRTHHKINLDPMLSCFHSNSHKTTTTSAASGSSLRRCSSLVSSLHPLISNYQCDNSRRKEVFEVCDLLEADADSVQSALTCRCFDDSVDTVVTDVCASEASSGRDALCRALYSRLFTYIVKRTNEFLKVKKHGRRRLLGILDLYGFESLEKNGFDQLIINFCNEKLHNVIIQTTLCDEQEEYIKEGIDWVPISYCQNEVICDLIENSKHGILGLLEEESLKCGPRSDEMFLTKLTVNLTGRIHFEAKSAHSQINFTQNNLPSHCFRLKHFAGPVTYDVRGFIERNRDAVSRDMSCAMFSCAHPLLRTLFPEGNPSRVGALRFHRSEGGDPTAHIHAQPPTLAAQFQVAITALLRMLANKQPHYVRCLRPNEMKVPRVFEHALVLRQIAYLGLLETVRVRRQGFCYKLPYSQFLTRYKMLSLATWPRWYRGSVAEGVSNLIRDLPIPNGEFAFGRTKVFVRSPRTVYELEEFRRERLHDLAVIIQKTWRKYQMRKLFLRKRQAQITISLAWRTWKNGQVGIPFENRGNYKWDILKSARQEYRILLRRKKLRWAVNVIQRSFLQWKRRQFLRQLSLALTKETESPIFHEWIIPNERLNETSMLLRKLHHKWRCQKYRKQFDQTSRNRMREKVTASLIFRDRKASYPRSVSHPFLGDYVRLRHNLQWKRMSADTNDQYVVFADIINKIARSSGKFVPVLFVLSTSSMLMLDQRTLQIKYRVPATEIYRLSLSPFLDGVAVFHIRAPASPCSDSMPVCNQDYGTAGCLFQSDLSRKKGDFVFQTGHAIEIVTKLFLVIQNAVGKPPEVNICTDFEANFGQQTVTLTFKCLGVPEMAPGQVRIIRKGNKMEILV